MKEISLTFNVLTAEFVKSELNAVLGYYHSISQLYSSQ